MPIKDITSEPFKLLSLDKAQTRQARERMAKKDAEEEGLYTSQRSRNQKSTKNGQKQKHKKAPVSKEYQSYQTQLTKKYHEIKDNNTVDDSNEESPQRTIELEEGFVQIKDKIDNNPGIDQEEIQYRLHVPRAKSALTVPIIVRDGQKPIKALIDSGAQACFISKGLAEALDLLKDAQEVEPVEVQVALKDHGKQTNLAVQIPIETKLENEIEIRTTVVAYVVEGIKDQVYLGLPFVIKYHEHIPWTQVDIPTKDAKGEFNTKEVFETSRPKGMENNDITFIDRTTFLREAKKSSNRIGLLQVKTESAQKVEETRKSPEKVRINLHETESTEVTQEPAIQKLLEKYKDVVTNKEPEGLPPERFITHRISLIEGTQPTHRRQYRLTLEERAELQKQVEELLNKGFIKESNSPYNAPVLFVKKKGGELRMCVDFRLLNLHTIKDRFPIPLIDEILGSLAESKYFSKLDLRSGYHQVLIDKNDTQKTAFSTTHNHYEWLVMPFGLTNAPSTFQRMMNHVLKEFVGKFVHVYLDDIIVFSDTLEKHLGHVEKILQVLRANQLVCKQSKCEFLKKELKFLGFVINQKGILPDPDKIQAVVEWSALRTFKDAQKFLGLAGFYRRFVKDYSKKATPLAEFAAQNAELGPEQEKAFETLKKELSTAPVLINPIFKEGYTFVVTSDACGTALGFTLEQLDPEGKKLGVIAYGSKKLQGAQLRYPVREKEFMAIIEALRTWRNLLMYQKFVIQTDHHSLIYLQHQNQLNTGRLARWLDFLSEFNFTIKHIPGRQNSAADALSRRDDCEEIEFAAMHTQAHIQELNEELLREIKKGLTRDPEFSAIYRCLKYKEEPSKLIKNHIKHYKLEEDLLLFNAIPGQDEYRVCVPNYGDLRTKLTANVHDLPTGAHFGYLRAYEVLQRQFYWPKMFRSIKRYVASCLLCQKSKPSTQLPQGLFKPLEVPKERFKEVTMDFLTGIPTTKQGHDMIFVIIDRFSKRAKMIPCQRSLTAAGAAQLFLQHYFCNYGLPRKIVSDKDIRFMGGFWQTIWAALGTTLLFTTTAHPQTDGQSERMMRVINQCLRAVCHNNLNSWDVLLPAIEFAYNSTVQSSTKKPPFEVDLGIVPDSPTYSSVWNTKYLNPQAEDLAIAMRSAGLQLKDQLVTAQRQQEEMHNRRRNVVNFKKNDWVLLHKHVFGPRDTHGKLLPYYLGPYQIVKMLGENVVELALPTLSRKQRTINVEYLKKYVERSPTYPRIPPRTNLETKHRISEINAVIGMNKDDETFTVTWEQCDPKHATIISFKQFDSIPSEQRKRHLIAETEVFREIPPEIANIDEPSRPSKEVMASSQRSREITTEPYLEREKQTSSRRRRM